jgi:hypothetical protein
MWKDRILVSSDLTINVEPRLIYSFRYLQLCSVSSYRILTNVIKAYQRYPSPQSLSSFAQFYCRPSDGLSIVRTRSVGSAYNINHILQAPVLHCTFPI